VDTRSKGFVAAGAADESRRSSTVVKKIAIGVVVVCVLVGTASVLPPDVSHADSIAVEQVNQQFALNIAVYCPGVEQSIVQVAGNGAFIVDLSATNVQVNQSNAQTGWNIALNSPGATQSIAQIAYNTTVIVGGAVSGVSVSQSNVASAASAAVDSVGASQSIGQMAGNSVGVSGSNWPAVGAFQPNVHQWNTQNAWNICHGFLR
jgi:hypothetical protein